MNDVRWWIPVARAACPLALLFLAACGSSGSRTLYAPAGGSRPVLLDGEIRMSTYWTGAPGEIPDVRSVTCAGGLVTVSHTTAKGVKQGHVSEAQWNDLWARLEPVAPWSPARFAVKPNDPQGGPYHVVELRAGEQVSQFSSQMKADLLVFTSREVTERLQYTNLIVDFVARHAQIRVEHALETPGAAPAPSTP